MRNQQKLKVSRMHESDECTAECLKNEIQLKNYILIALCQPVHLAMCQIDELSSMAKLKIETVHAQGVNETDDCRKRSLSVTPSHPTIAVNLLR